MDRVLGEEVRDRVLERVVSIRVSVELAVGEVVAEDVGEVSTGGAALVCWNDLDSQKVGEQNWEGVGCDRERCIRSSTKNRVGQ